VIDAVSLMPMKMRGIARPDCSVEIGPGGTQRLSAWENSDHARAVAIGAAIQRLPLPRGARTQVVPKTPSTRRPMHHNAVIPSRRR